MTTALLCACHNYCGWHHYDYVFMKTLLMVTKKGYKNWGPKILAFLSLQ